MVRNVFILSHNYKGEYIDRTIPLPFITKGTLYINLS